MFDELIIETDKNILGYDISSDYLIILQQDNYLQKGGKLLSHNTDITNLIIYNLKTKSMTKTYIPIISNDVQKIIISPNSKYIAIFGIYLIIIRISDLVIEYIEYDSNYVPIMWFDDNIIYIGDIGTEQCSIDIYKLNINENTETFVMHFVGKPKYYLFAIYDKNIYAYNMFFNKFTNLSDTNEIAKNGITRLNILCTGNKFYNKKDNSTIQEILSINPFTFGKEYKIPLSKHIHLNIINDYRYYVTCDYNRNPFLHFENENNKLKIIIPNKFKPKHLYDITLIHKYLYDWKCYNDNIIILLDKKKIMYINLAELYTNMMNLLDVMDIPSEIIYIIKSYL